MPRRLHREAASLADALTVIQQEYGPSARIVAAEAVTVGGFRGLFARRYFDIEFEVPDGAPGAPTGAAGPVAPGASAAGIDALLRAAEQVEGDWMPGAAPHAAPTPSAHGAAAPAPAAAPRPSTERPEFAELLAELSATTTGVREPAAVPVARGERGALVMVIGAGEAAWEQARTIAADSGAILAQAGAHERAGFPRGDDRRRARALRADAVGEGRSTVLAAGLPASIPVSASRLQALDDIGADQIWLVVDAARKADDTARWVTAIGAVLPVDALAVIGVAATASPETVDALGIPIGWIDGRPAARPRLG